MGKGNNRSVRKADVIKAFQEQGIQLSDGGRRMLNVQELPAGIKPTRPLVLHYDDRGLVQAYEVAKFSRAVNVDPHKLDLI